MKNTILITVLVGAVAGASGSMLTRALGPAEAGETHAQPSSSGLSPGESSPDEALVEQVRELQRRNDELAMRLAAVEKLSAGSGRQAVASEAPEDYAELQRDIADLAAALKDPQSAQSAGLRNSVRSAMEQIREEENSERQRDREEREIARIDERLNDLQGKLGLDQVQMKSMREVLLTESSKRSEFFQQMRSGGVDRSSIRSAMGELRDETRSSLGNILTPMQLEDYEKLESGNRFGGFGGGGGRGGRGARAGTDASQSD